MYKLSVPVMAATVNERNRQRYAELFKSVGAERIFLAVGSIETPITDTLKENVAFFKSLGYEVGVWTDTIGHGVLLSHVEADDTDNSFTQMVDITGAERPHANCPLDPRFRRYASEHIAKLAQTGVDIVMLDDDLRMSEHGGELCCACSLHIKRICEIVGEEISLEELRGYVMTGKANRYRDAWLKAQNEGLIELAKDIRSAVDASCPNVTVCTCTAFATWNVDCADIWEITRILAGNNKPIIRLTGAPYWAVKSKRYPLIAVFEIARMISSFVDGAGFEVWSEGDVYPRPRYTCPASFLELYDAVTRIDGGYDGILKYMFDYVAGPDFEMGYVNAHIRETAIKERTAMLFEGGALGGVRVVSFPHTIKYADHDISVPSDMTPRPFDGTMLGSCGIPTVYRGKGTCNSVFGDNAYLYDLSELSNGTVLDAVSAVILSEKGIDVGLERYGGFEEKNIQFICTDDEFKSHITDGNVRFLSAKLKKEAKPVIFISEQREKVPMAYKYENKNGERFLVFLFDGSSVYEEKKRVCLSGLAKNKVTQRVLAETLPWVGREPLPVSVVGNPELYVMCKKQDDAISVALFNCFADQLDSPVITLDGAYDRIECVGCEASLSGDKVTLESPVYGYTYVSFKVYKNI